MGKGNVEKDVDRAFQLFSEACNKDPSTISPSLNSLGMAAAYHYRGRCYMHMDDYQRALYDFTLAIKLDH